MRLSKPKLDDALCRAVRELAAAELRRKRDLYHVLGLRLPGEAQPGLLPIPLDEANPFRKGCFTTPWPLRSARQQAGGQEAGRASMRKASPRPAGAAV